MNKKIIKKNKDQTRKFKGNLKDGKKWFVLKKKTIKKIFLKKNKTCHIKKWSSMSGLKKKPNK
jgi:hypothetical protein